ncbi:MAG TPA: tRNA epoxyqueuosine(34) reductase QueG [Planctomycetota bacterium]|nr:tRNA epoxyqueuosine(34) reductase QueG [Planctomycetota bacterium]
MASRSERIEEAALEEGFDLASLGPASPPPDAGAFDDWLAKGRDAPGIGYVRRNRERLLDPRRLLEGARSVLSLAVNHARAPGGFRESGRVARYALGRDYHRVLGKMLRRLLGRLRREGLVQKARPVVDAGPILERSHAARAGIGFPSKSANLLHPRFGPWTFLAELVTDAEPDGKARRLAGSCGTCTRCLVACPTGAIVEPFVVDSNRCLSYLTIENRGPIPEPLRPLLGEWVFGCDVCSEVCPFGWRAPDASSRFGRHPALDRSLPELLSLDEEAFALAFRGSAMKRPRRAGLLRNAAVVLGNRGDPAAAPALERASRDTDPIVREHAAWALARLGRPAGP